jgi:putative protease
MLKPELIVPGGSPEKMDFAFTYGADTVYMGLTGFSMRSRVNDFDKESLKKAVEKAHKLGKKIYVTVNIYPHNSKIDVFREHIKYLSEIKPDALIVADPGVFSLIKEEYPDAKIHISVQANCINYKDVEFWQKQDAKRVVLPRELSLNEIREIHEKVPGMELEAFVHGAICVAYSGRCLLSQYMTHRDANQGICAQSCRWKYKTYLEEEMRPGEFMPIEEDENGSYLLNSRDICALPYLRDLKEAGVCGFKIEGRSKSIYYLSTVTNVYRRAVDDIESGRDYDPSLMTELLKTANRGFSPGFLKGTYTHEDIHYEKNEPLQTHKFIGVVRDHKGLTEIRNRIKAGDEVEVFTPDETFKTKVKEIIDEDGNALEAAHGGAGERILKFCRKVPEGAFLRKNISPKS